MYAVQTHENFQNTLGVISVNYCEEVGTLWELQLQIIQTHQNPQNHILTMSREKSAIDLLSL